MFIAARDKMMRARVCVYGCVIVRERAKTKGNVQKQERAFSCERGEDESSREEREESARDEKGNRVRSIPAHAILIPRSPCPFARSDTRAYYLLENRARLSHRRVRNSKGYEAREKTRVYDLRAFFFLKLRKRFTFERIYVHRYAFENVKRHTHRRSLFFFFVI